MDHKPSQIAIFPVHAHLYICDLMPALGLKEATGATGNVLHHWNLLLLVYFI